jgi:hypothetical protein
VTEPKTPEILDKMVDMVLAYRPKPKSGAAKKRKRAEKQAAAEGKIPKTRKSR